MSDTLLLGLWLTIYAPLMTWHLLKTYHVKFVLPLIALKDHQAPVAHLHVKTEEAEQQPQVRNGRRRVPLEPAEVESIYEQLQVRH